MNGITGIENLKSDKCTEVKEICNMNNITNNNVKKLNDNDLVNYFIDKFEDYFSKSGFEKHQSLPLTGVDKTILFTNSAIVSLKKYIKNNIKIPSYFIVQPCIRVQNLNIEYNDSIKYISSFNMIGAFVDKNKYNNFIDKVWIFIEKYLGYKKEEIKIFCNKNHKKLIEGWLKLEGGPEIIYSNENFDWKFGEGDLMIGNGFSFRVLNKKGEYTDIGNIMEVISNGKIIGYGLGLGVETLVSHKNGYSNPIEFFTKKGGIEIGNNMDIHLYDTIKLLLDSYKNGIRPSKKGVNYQLKKAFKKINSIINENTSILLSLEEQIQKFEFNNYLEFYIGSEIYNEILEKSNYEITNKSLSLLINKDEDINVILESLKYISPYIQYEFIEEYIGDNIGIDKKSLTFKLKFISKKGKSKEYFKLIVEEINKCYKIR